MNEDIIFCLAGGEGDIGKQASWCVESILNVYPDATIYVGTPLQENQSEPLPKVVRLLDVEFPIEDYPNSIKGEIIRRVEKNHKNRTICLLDTDTLVLQKLDLPPQGEIMLKPEHVMLSRAGLDDQTRFDSVFGLFDLEAPEVKIKSTVDNCMIRPFYQAGVIITRGIEIGERYTRYMRDIWGRHPGEYHTDQLALSVIAEQHEVSELREKQHFPLVFRTYCPRDTELVHYRGEKHLKNKMFMHRDILDKLGIKQHGLQNWLSISLISFYIRELQWTGRQRFKWWVNKL